MITYILKSLALYHIGKREGVKAYGLAWVPILRGWVTGSIADKHDAYHNKPDRKFRVFNLIISILNISAIIVLLIIGSMVAAKLGSSIRESSGYYDLNLLQYQFFALLGGLGILAFLLLAAVGIMSTASVAIDWVCKY